MIKRRRPISLKWRLILQLVLFQIVTLVIFAAGYVVLMLFLDDFFAGVSPKELSSIAEDINSDGDGALHLPQTHYYSNVFEADPDLWLIARSDKGAILQAGNVPPQIARQMADTGSVSLMELDREQLGEAPIALVHVSSAAGPLTVVGGGIPIDSTYYVVTMALLLVLPWILLMTVLSLIVTPFIVSRLLSVIRKIAQEAEGVDIDKPEQGLGKAGVPKEVEPLVEAVNSAMKRLDEGYQRQKRIVVDTAHELRTPVAILQTRLETLEDSPTRSKLMSDAARVAALAEQLLDLQRLNVVGIDPVPVDLVALCAEVAADMAPLAIQQGIHISFDSSEPKLTVNGDAGALRRAIANLVQNALEHSETTGDVMIRVNSDHSVEVADHGKGIPPKDRETIFEPFHRLKARDHGAGLGLNLVREIVRKHGAEIAVIDEPGGGACFRIAFTQPRGPRPQLGLKPTE